MTPTYTIPVGAGLTVHVPLARKLTPRDRADIEFAMMTAGAGYGDLGRKAIIEFEERAERYVLDKAKALDRRKGIVAGGFLAVSGVAAEVSRREARLQSALDRRPAARPARRNKTDAEIRREYWADRLVEENSRLQAAVSIANGAARDKAIRAAADARDQVLAALKDLDSAEYLRARRDELTVLEARRGGEVIVETVVIDVPVMRANGTPRKRGGKVVTKPQVAETVRLTARDGLETLATSNLHTDGTVRMTPDKKTPMAPAIDRIQLAALMRYRGLYEDSDPEAGLRAVDPGNAGGGRTPSDPWDCDTVKSIQGRAEAAGLVRKLEQHVRETVEAEHGLKAGALSVVALREVAGKGLTVRSLVGGGSANVAMVLALVRAGDALADRFGLQ